MKPKPSPLRRLRTEQSNQAANDLDQKSSLEIAHLINAEDATVALAVTRALPQIARAIRSEERRVGKECRSRWSPYH